MSRMVRSPKAPLPGTLLLVFLAGVAISCGQGKMVRDPAKRSSAVVIPEGATIARYVRVGRSESAFYSVATPFPARVLLKTIKLQLAHHGWSPAKVFMEDPQIATSNVAGWGEYVDDTKKPPRLVRSWQGEWRKNGEVLDYRLTYETGRTGILMVSILREPASDVRVFNSRKSHVRVFKPRKQD